MRNSILIILLLFGTTLWAQTAEKEVQSTIEAMFQEVFSDLNESKISKFFTSDIVIFEDGEIYTPDMLKKGIQNAKDFTAPEKNDNKTVRRENSFEFYKTEVNGNKAWVTYKNNAKFSLEGTMISQITWLESAHLVKTDEGWKIEFLHSTIMKEAEK